MKRILDFLRELQEHNDREWFETHRTEYLRVKAATEEFAARLIAGIASFDSTVGDLTPKECTYRIYRDIRFSSDKRPYKSHIGIFISPGGKKSGHSGYYLHIEPEHPERSDGVPSGGPMLVTGLYMPEPAVLKSVREEILFNGEEFVRNIGQAQDFSLNRENALKRVPVGFPTDSPYAEYLRLKDFCLERPVSEAFLLSPALLARVTASFAPTAPFNRQLNRAVDFALDEM